MFLEGLKFNYIKDDLLNNYLAMIFNDPNFALGYSNREILDFIVKSRKVSQRKLLYDYLFNQIFPNKLNFHSDAIQGMIVVSGFLLIVISTQKLMNTIL